MNFFGIFIKFTFISPILSISLDTELVFQIGKHFKSNLILIVKDEVHTYEYTKTFYSMNFPHKILIGTIDVHKNFEHHIKEVISTPFLNILVVSNTVNLLRRLEEVHRSYSNMMARLIWINFIGNDSYDEIKNLYIPFNSKFFIVKNKEESITDIIDIYQIDENSSQIFSVFATWKNKNFITFNNDLSAKRADLKGRQFNIALSPFLEFREDDDELWHLYSSFMNFSFNYVPVSHGGLYPNGTMTGLFKSIDDNEIDLTPTTYVYSKERLTFFDYIFPIIISEEKMYLQLESGLNWTSYLAPFSTAVWISILCWMIIASAVIKLVTQNRKHTEIHVEDSTLFVLRAICYQSGQVKGSCFAFYISYVMPYILGMVLIQFYSGAILSYVTVKNSDPPFRNLQEVIEEGTYKIMILNGMRLLFYFQTDPGAEATAVRNNLLVPKNQLPARIQDGFHRLCENRYIFLCPSVKAKVKEKCDIIEIKGAVYNEALGIIVKKGFPYRDIMTKLLRRFQIAGLQEIKKKNIIIPNEDSKNFISLPIESVFPIFLFYLSVLILSGLILIFEIIV